MSFAHNFQIGLNPSLAVFISQEDISMSNLIRKSLTYITKLSYRILDSLFLPLDKRRIHRAKNIRLIPIEIDRRGGKYAYAEWAHVIGIFQTLINQNLDPKKDPQILDIGCGTGLIGIACEPFLTESGKYIGIDVMAEDIDFCRGYYPPGKYEFVHLDVSNPFYSPNQKDIQIPWPIDSGSIDLATALSVWTHFGEVDARFYLGEVNRVLKPGGTAIITFFLLDDLYEKSLIARDSQQSAFHATRKDRWIFNQPAYGSADWLHPHWAQTPENAIGITSKGFDNLITGAGLQVKNYYPGNWKEIPGLYFQDVIVFNKKP